MSKNYTVKEVSQIIGVTEITVKRRIKDGSLRAYKEKNKLFIAEEDFNAFLETHPKYSRKVKQCGFQSHQSETHDAVVDAIATNEVFNVYASFLKKLLMLPKNDDTINYILPIVENPKSLLDLVINELERRIIIETLIERR